MPASLLLTDAERQRFAEWLEREAKNGFDMVEIMVKNKMPGALIQKERAEALAAQVIAKKLRQTESFTIGG